MAAVRHLEFWKLAVFVLWPLSACRSPFWCKISLISDNRLMSYGQKSDFQDGGRRHLEFKKIQFFGHVTVTGFNIWCSVPNFIKIGWFFTEIWRFNDFQNVDRPASWILHMCIFCPVVFVSMPFCFRMQNFAEIGQSVDELWPKRRFLWWRPPPSWILKISIFGQWL